MIVARNPASANRATSYAERLRLGLAVIHGEQKESESDRIDGRHSPPPVASGSSSQALGMPGLPCKYQSIMLQPLYLVPSSESLMLTLKLTEENVGKRC